MILQASQKLILNEKIKLGTRLKAEIIRFRGLKRAKRKRNVEKKKFLMRATCFPCRNCIINDMEIGGFTVPTDITPAGTIQ